MNKIKSQNSRFLYLFFIDRNCLSEAVDALTQNLDWEIIEKPYGLYYDEMLYRVKNFLFSNKQAGIELFLSYYGVGILSITLTNKNPSDFDRILGFLGWLGLGIWLI
ncbi:hypothetical protein [Candidatus Marithrix sp. Canyon 246]|uniref:hypothetical protein n=1 Tax=Candidatus Marithrix sp. Canyon 246 TaxID=1827136 RepID=UPI000849F4AA|nr:hypothetical protein [Candidatus Marithrix sp. Canyon 246]